MTERHEPHHTRGGVRLSPPALAFSLPREGCGREDDWAMNKNPCKVCAPLTECHAQRHKLPEPRAPSCARLVRPTVVDEYELYTQ